MRQISYILLSIREVCAKTKWIIGQRGPFTNMHVLLVLQVYGKMMYSFPRFPKQQYRTAKGQCRKYERVQMFHISLVLELSAVMCQIMVVVSTGE